MTWLVTASIVLTALLVAGLVVLARRRRSGGHDHPVGTRPAESADARAPLGQNNWTMGGGA